MRSLLAWLAVAVAISPACLAETPGQGMQLEVTGPDGQWVSVAVGYFGPRQSKSRRLQLSGGRATLPLASGHSGYAVHVLSPTKRPIVVRLHKQGRVVDEKKTNGIDSVMVRAGRVASADSVVPADFSLTESHRASVYSYMLAFLKGETESVVSNVPITNIDWPSLNAYSAVTWQSLGKPRDSDLDGWASWEGKKNARIYAGPLQFENGEANVILAELNEKLVDFIITSDRLPDGWFTGPRAVDVYTNRAEELMRLMFQGNVQQAHKQFSFRVQKDITVKTLQEVHETLVDRFGDSIDEITRRSVQVDPVKDPNNRNLTLLFDIETNKGLFCEGRVEVLLDRAVGTIPRGHLTSFNVREKGPSISSERKQSIEKVIRSLLRGDSDVLTEMLHPAAKTLINVEQLEAEVMRWESEFGRATSDIAWTDWADSAIGRAVEGPVVVKHGLVTARVELAGEKLLGVTLSGNTYSGSTLDHTVELPKLADHGQQFWTHLFSNRHNQAYDLLPPVFQKQLSLQQFKAMGAKVAEVAAIGIESVNPTSIRFNSRPDRVEDVMVTAFYRIRFKNETYQSGRCEYHIEAPGEFAIYNFNTEFDDEFPVPFDPYTGFTTAITSGDEQSVIQMFHPSDRKGIDPIVLRALMLEIRESLGELTGDSVKGVARRRFENGAQRTYVSADFPFEQANVPVQWSYLYGWLKSFDVESSKLAMFAKRIEDTTSFRQRGIEFYSRWFQNGIPQALAAMRPQVRNQTTSDQLVSRRESVIKKLGAFRKVDFVAEEFDEQANSLRQKFSLTFDRGTATGSVAIMFDAMHSHIAVADVKVDVPQAVVK